MELGRTMNQTAQANQREASIHRVIREIEDEMTKLTELFVCHVSEVNENSEER